MFRCKNCGMGNTTVEEHVVEGDDVLLKEFCKDCGAFTYHSLCRVVSTLNQSLISVAGARVPNTCSECRFLESNACEFDPQNVRAVKHPGVETPLWCPMRFTPEIEVLKRIVEVEELSEWNELLSCFETSQEVGEALLVLANRLGITFYELWFKGRTDTMSHKEVVEWVRNYIVRRFKPKDRGITYAWGYEQI